MNRAIQINVAHLNCQWATLSLAEFFRKSCWPNVGCLLLVWRSLWVASCPRYSSPSSWKRSSSECINMSLQGDTVIHSSVTDFQEQVTFSCMLSAWETDRNTQEIAWLLFSGQLTNKLFLLNAHAWQREVQPETTFCFLIRHEVSGAHGEAQHYSSHYSFTTQCHSELMSLLQLWRPICINGRV